MKLGQILRDYHRRKGVVSTAVLALFLMSAGVFVIAISSQARAGRNLQVGEAAAHQACVLANSAISEALAYFNDSVGWHFDDADALASRAENGIVDGSVVLDQEKITWVPPLTSALVADPRKGVKDPIIVTARALPFQLGTNSGQIELSCTVTVKTYFGREITRRVTTRHTISVDVDGETLNVIDVPNRQMIDQGEKK